MNGHARTALRRLPPRLVIAVVIAIMGVVGYYSQTSHNEITGEKQHVQLTPHDEVALGLQAAPEMARQFGGVLRDARGRYVASVGERLVARSDVRSTPYRFAFHVLADDRTVNAFALPGGQVFITVALLKELEDEAQLAAVLGHEIGHVAARHGAEHLAKQRLTGTLVGAVGVATYDPDDPRSRNAAAIAAAVGQLVNLRYGREDELESDALGVRFMTDAGYDPRGAVELMRILARAAGKGRTPEFFSTHPNPERRVARLEELAAKHGAGGERAAERFRANVGQLD